MDDVVHRYRFHAVGAWAGAGADSTITDMQRHITQDLIRSVRHILIMDGLDPDDVKFWVRSAMFELEKLNVRLYTKVRSLFFRQLHVQFAHAFILL
jgi:hypothetical protein